MRRKAGLIVNGPLVLAVLDDDDLSEPVMTRPAPRLAIAVLLAGACVLLSGCVVGAVTGAAVGVAATTVKTSVKVAGATAGAAANGVGAVAHAATSGGH